MPAAARSARHTIAAATVATGPCSRLTRPRWQRAGCSWERKNRTCCARFAVTTVTPRHSAAKAKVMKNKTVKVDFLARVEGEGGLYVKVKGKAVADVQFRIFEPPRFFEA